jgi:sugar/nucleoside kinase (ribokinase family)
MSARRGPLDPPPSPMARPLRIVASGTLFVTHTLAVPALPPPGPSSAVRAHAVTRARGGAASTVLSMLAQFPAVDAMLVAPLSGNDEGRAVLRELRDERVSTRYARVWDDLGVPSAWVVQAGQRLALPCRRVEMCV